MNIKTIIGSTVICVLLFLLLTTKSKGTEDTTSFAKKKECATYIENIKTDISSQSTGQIRSKHTLDEVWYSPSRNSCLYSFESTITFSDSPESILGYTIKDYLENKTVLTFTDMGTSTNGYFQFQDAKANLKK